MHRNEVESIVSTKNVSEEGTWTHSLPCRGKFMPPFVMKTLKEKLSLRA